MTTMRKVLAASAVALALASLPSRLAAQEERTVPAEARASVAEWFSGVWSKLTVLLGGESSPPTARPAGGATTDGGCAVDPHGGCVEGG